MTSVSSKDRFPPRTAVCRVANERFKSTHLRHSYPPPAPDDWEIGANATGGDGSDDEGRAARLRALARSTGGFNRLAGRGARFAVAQVARGSDPSLATARHPGNVSLRPQATRRFWRLRHGLGGYVLARQGATRTRISKVMPAGTVIFCRGARQSDRGVLRREKSQRGEMS